MPENFIEKIERLEKENSELKQRIEKLEAENAELKEALKKLEEKVDDLMRIVLRKLA
ncbi:hypothetical protein [Thermococcus sp.]